jgi:hypothetical protein
MREQYLCPSRIYCFSFEKHFLYGSVCAQNFPWRNVFGVTGALLNVVASAAPWHRVTSEDLRALAQGVLTVPETTGSGFSPSAQVKGFLLHVDSATLQPFYQGIYCGAAWRTPCFGLGL